MGKLPGKELYFSTFPNSMVTVKNPTSQKYFEQNFETHFVSMLPFVLMLSCVLHQVLGKLLMRRRSVWLIEEVFG